MHVESLLDPGLLVSHDFNNLGPLGTVAVASETVRFRPVLKQQRYFVSHLFPTYRAYSREHFIATLDDWRWFGPW